MTFLGKFKYYSTIVMIKKGLSVSYERSYGTKGKERREGIIHRNTVVLGY